MHPRSWVITEPYTEDKPGSLDSPAHFPYISRPRDRNTYKSLCYVAAACGLESNRDRFIVLLLLSLAVARPQAHLTTKGVFLSPSSAQAFFGTTRLACGLQGIIEKLADTKVPAIFLRAGTRDSRPNKNRAPKTKTRPLLQRHKTVPPVQAPGDGV